MSYATFADLQNKIDEEQLIQHTDDEDTGSVNMTVIEAALEAADSEIDSYLAEQDYLPFGDVPKVIVHMAADIAIVNLFSRRNGPPEHWEKKYENHKAFLEKVMDGEISLGISTAQTNDTVQFTTSGRIFSRDKMKGF